jgi:3-dehydroquinate dehydratase-1
VIVASLGAWLPETTGADLSGIEAVELRLDLMGASIGELPVIIGLAAAVVPRIIITCRPGRMVERERVALLCESARLGIWAVDIEIDAPLPSRAAVVAAARSHGRTVIVSYHDHERTPSRQALCRITRRAFAAGADIVKIACRVRIPADSATLLGLLDVETASGRIAVLGMGPAGRLVRVVAPLLGSPLAYVSLREGLETADGQLTRDEIARAWSVCGTHP